MAGALNLCSSDDVSMRDPHCEVMLSGRTSHTRVESISFLVPDWICRVGMVIYHMWCFVIRWCCGGGVSSILAFVWRHFQLYDTSPRIPNWPWAWPCWNCTTSYKFSVSVKKIGEGWTGGASDIVKAESSGEDPRATQGLVSNLPHPRVNKTKQHTGCHGGPLCLPAAGPTLGDEKHITSQCPASRAVLHNPKLFNRFWRSDAPDWHAALPITRLKGADPGGRGPEVGEGKKRENMGGKGLGGAEERGYGGG